MAVCWALAWAQQRTAAARLLLRRCRRPRSRRWRCAPLARGNGALLNSRPQLTRLPHSLQLPLLLNLVRLQSMGSRLEVPILLHNLHVMVHLETGTTVSPELAIDSYQ